MSLNSTLAPALTALLYTSLDVQAQIRPIPIIITSSTVYSILLQCYTAVYYMYHLPYRKYIKLSKVRTYVIISINEGTYPPRHPEVDGGCPFPRTITSKENGVLRNNRSRTSK